MKKVLTRVIILLVAVSLSACTQATEDVYSEYWEEGWIPNPDYVATDASSEQDSASDNMLNTPSDNTVTESENLSSDTNTGNELPSDDSLTQESENSSKNEASSDDNISEESNSNEDTSTKDDVSINDNVSEESNSNENTSSNNEASSDEKEELDSSVYYNINEEAKTIYVKDFGAKGDGVTDDGPAINEAIIKLWSCGPGSKLVFESNKTYYVKKTDNTRNAALNIQNLTGITIQGNNTTILCDPAVKDMMDIYYCDDFTVSGFNFDLSIRSHFAGDVLAINVDEGYIDVKSDRDFGYYTDFVPRNAPFCLVNTDEHTPRKFIRLAKLSCIDKENLIYRVYADMDDDSLGTAGQVKALTLDNTIIVPTPEIGESTDSNCFNVQLNEDVTLKDINIWNVKHFVMAARWNTGKIYFKNVDTVPPEDETVNFCSWRDVYHCKSNSGQLVWEDCESRGNGDDIINISSNMMYVSQVISQNEIVCTWPETGGSYGEPEIGSEVIIWNEVTGALIGQTTLAKVVNSAQNHYILKDAIPNIKSGENIRFCFKSHAAPGSQIINCDFDGTLRFRGRINIENSKFTLMKMWIDTHQDLEGPIPYDVAFKNCKFNVVGGNDALIISSNSPQAIWKEGLYRLENISFTNCTGLKKSYFSNDLNFVANSTDYIKISPALTE